MIKILDINNGNNNKNNELHIIRRSSYYYDFEFFYSVIKNNNKHFNILSSNIQSISAKFSELEAFVNDLSSLNFKFSIVHRQECWLSDIDDISLIQLSGYDCISQGKSCHNKCGLITYINISTI